MKINKDTLLEHLPRPFQGFYEARDGQLHVLTKDHDAVDNRYLVVSFRKVGSDYVCTNGSGYHWQDDAWRMFCLLVQSHIHRPLVDGETLTPVELGVDSQGSSSPKRYTLLLAEADSIPPLLVTTEAYPEKPFLVSPAHDEFQFNDNHKLRPEITKKGRELMAAHFHRYDNHYAEGADAQRTHDQ